MTEIRAEKLQIPSFHMFLKLPLPQKLKSQCCIGHMIGLPCATSALLDLQMESTHCLNTVGVHTIIQGNPYQRGKGTLINDLKYTRNI